MKEIRAFLWDVLEAVVVLVVVVILLALIAGKPAFGHTAPSGWAYDQSCCSNEDCSQLPPGAVQITPKGYLVTVRPEDNKQLYRTKVYLIPFKTTGIRISGDKLYHICLNKQYEAMTNEGGKEAGGSWLCFYIPPSGF